MSDFRITSVVTQWLEMKEWGERPELNEENDTSRTAFGYQVSDEHSCRIFFEVVEGGGIFKLFAYCFDHKVPTAKLKTVLEWINLVNNELYLGHLVVTPEKNHLRFYVAMDVEDAGFEPQHITNLLNAAGNVMAERIPQMLAIMYGNLTAEQALDYEPDAEPSSDDVPDEL